MSRKVAPVLLSAVATALLLAACGGSGHKKPASAHRHVFAATGGGRTMQFSFADASTGPATVQVPAQLDANFGSVDTNNEAASRVSLFDPAGLKEYLPFMANPSVDATCLCSNIGAGSEFNSGGSFYLAALLAAPPPSVTSVSFVTGLGTIGNVPLS